MNRRKFVSRTSAGLLAVSLAPGCWSCSFNNPKKKYYKFRQYRPSTTPEKIMIVTPEDGFYMHTYYDICPWSSSGKYLAVTKVPFQDHDPLFGESAEVCVIDLEEQSIQTVYETKAWGFQLGASLNWGQTDQYLYTNDVIDGQGVCVRIDLETREVRAFKGYKTHLAPDETHFLGFSSDLINASQRGYAFPTLPQGSVELPEPGTILTNEGICRTDLQTDQMQLIASIYDFYELVPNPEEFADRSMVLFFSKYNRQGTRALEFLRGVHPNPKQGIRKFVQMAFSHKSDGSDIVQAVTYGVHDTSTDWSNWKPDWKPGGHHITWTPDGESLTMNLVPDGKKMRFCRFNVDGSDFEVLSETIKGGGHPSMEKTGRFLVVDAYPDESIVLPNKEVPIRLIDLEEDKEITLCYVYTLGIKGPTRCDPHPCWNRDYTQVCFNGTPEGGRQVFVADLKSIAK